MTESDFKATRQRIATYAKQHWRLFAAAIAMFIVGSAVEPVVPWLFKKLLDSGFQNGLDYPLWMVPVVVIGLFLVRGLANYAGNFTMSYATSAVVLSMRKDLMRALVHADASLFTKLSPGQLVAKVVNEPHSASTILGNTAVGVIRDFFTLLFLVAYLLYLNWQLTLVVFTVAALLTQILSDAATTVLLAPIALALATGLGLNPVPFVVCTAMGAVASFLTPIGHHGNLLILNPGRYTFGDFLRVGVPLTAAIALTTAWLARWLWLDGPLLPSIGG